MHVAQVSDDVLVNYSCKEENLLGRVGGLLFNQITTALRAKQLETFHLADIVHDLVLLC